MINKLKKHKAWNCRLTVSEVPLRTRLPDRTYSPRRDGTGVSLSFWEVIEN